MAPNQATYVRILHHEETILAMLVFVSVLSVLADTSLKAVAEQVTEDTYSYDHYWAPIEDAVECPDKIKNITKTLKKKGGGTKNCSKIKHLDHINENKESNNSCAAPRLLSPLELQSFRARLYVLSLICNCIKYLTKP